MAIEERFGAFLRCFRSPTAATDEFLYLSHLRRMLANPVQQPLLVDLAHFDVTAATLGLSFEPSELRSEIIENYMTVHSALDATVSALASSLAGDDSEWALRADDVTVVFRGLPAKALSEALGTGRLGQLMVLSGVVLQANCLVPEPLFSGSPPPAPCETGPGLYQDMQRIALREPGVAAARQLSVVLRGGLCASYEVGTSLLLTGCLVPSGLHMPPKRGSVAKAHDVEFLSIFVERDASPTADMQESVFGDQGGLGRLAEMIAPSVQGHVEAKRAIALMLLGGVQKDHGRGVPTRSNINVCLIGGAASGKSELLKWTARHVPQCAYVAGAHITGAGLTAMEETGCDGFQPGALLTSEVCCVDQLEALTTETQAAIQEALSQHTVTVAKKGIFRTLPAKASILAATCGGAGLAALQHFDLCVCLSDDAGVGDKVLAQSLLGACGAHVEHTAATAECMELVGKLRASQSFSPTLGAAAADRATCSYTELRRIGGSPRDLHCLIRLAEAAARAEARQEVTERHMEVAMSLLRPSVAFVAGVQPEPARKFRRTQLA